MQFEITFIDLPNLICHKEETNTQPANNDNNNTLMLSQIEVDFIRVYHLQYTHIIHQSVIGS